MYTREEILALPAGRELDALVARTLFGLDGLHLMHEFLPHYSTDIAAAFEVVEKRCETEGVKFGIDRDYSVKGKWNGGFNYGGGSYAAYASVSAPESICRAALLSLLSLLKED
jgi:hypothetical protein